MNRLFDKDAPLLTWELEGYSYGNLRLYYVTITLALFAIGCAACGVGILQFVRLGSGQPSAYEGWLWSTWWAVGFGVAFIAIPAAVVGTFVVREMQANAAERGEQTQLPADDGRMSTPDGPHSTR